MHESLETYAPSSVSYALRRSAGSPHAGEPGLRSDQPGAWPSAWDGRTAAEDRSGPQPGTGDRAACGLRSPVQSPRELVSKALTFTTWVLSLQSRR